MCRYGFILLQSLYRRNKAIQWVQDYKNQAASMIARNWRMRKLRHWYKALQFDLVRQRVQAYTVFKIEQWWRIMVIGKRARGIMKSVRVLQTQLLSLFHFYRGTGKLHAIVMLIRRAIVRIQSSYR